LNEVRKQEAAYRIAIEPVAGRVRARIGGETVADSTNVVAMHETYLPTQYYFPKSDLAEGLLAPSPFRTFCPIKGTAHHWHLRLPGSTLENRAWSYEAPLQESQAVGGFVAFYLDAIDEMSAEQTLPEVPREQIGGSPLFSWLMQQAWQCKTPAELTEQLAARLQDMDIPLWRFNVNIWTLHPELAGQRFTWARDVGGVTESDTPHGILQTPAYLNSPVRHVSAGLGGVRQRLDIDDPEFQFPVLDELRANGGTDYVAMPLPFSDGQFQTMTLATDHPDGFSTAMLGQVFRAAIPLGRFYEVLTLRRNADDLFDTYLGHRTGRQILRGLTRRGDGEDIRAAILFCDLRDSTVLTESLSRQTYLDLLNEFFECAAEPVLGNGGEVLKFIGDAVLAIFPVDGEDGDDAAIAKACQRAFGAAQDIIARIAAVPARADRPAMHCAIGLHFGNVMYGNVGSPKRLDFTVIGTAANIAARLSGHCKTLEQSVLLSADVAQHLPATLHSLGTQRLRNVADDLELFGIGGAEFG
jgi:adenylate cyclase